MSPLPSRYAPLVYGIIQAGITSAIAAAVATYKIMGLGMDFLMQWGAAWLVAWATMIPVVVLVAPLIQRAVLKLTAPTPLRDLRRQR